MSSFNRIIYNENSCYRLKHINGKFAKDSTIPELHHTLNIILVYFISGAGNVKIEGKQYNLTGGEVIMFTPSKLYKLTVNDGQYHERIVLTTNEIWMKKVLTNPHPVFMPFYKIEKEKSNVISPEGVKKYGLDARFNELLELTKNRDSVNDIIATCKVAEILSLIGKILNTEFSQNRERKNPLIQQALIYINKHLREDINISQISKKLNINKSYLSHLFKECVGMSLMNYVILRRIYLFNHLIKENNSIEKTAYEVGFRNYSNFFRLYKKHMGMTPLEFKKINEKI